MSSWVNSKTPTFLNPRPNPEYEAALTILSPPSPRIQAVGKPNEVMRRCVACEGRNGGGDQDETDQWSRLDSPDMSGNTDHWTKMKVQSMPLRGAQPGDVINGSYYNQSGHVRFEKHPGCNCEHTREVTQAHVDAFKDNSSKKMNQLNEGRLTVEAPKSGIKKQWMNNCYQRRAREGFRYWLIYRPPPTKFGKHGIGSYKTVMGMGMAPRT